MIHEPMASQDGLLVYRHDGKQNETMRLLNRKTYSEAVQGLWLFSNGVEEVFHQKTCLGELVIVAFFVVNASSLDGLASLKYMYWYSPYQFLICIRIDPKVNISCKCTYSQPFLSLQQLATYTTQPKDSNQNSEILQ